MQLQLMTVPADYIGISEGGDHLSCESSGLVYYFKV